MLLFMAKVLVLMVINNWIFFKEKKDFMIILTEALILNFIFYFPIFLTAKILMGSTL